MQRFPPLGIIALILLGCGGGDSTAPPAVPDLAGTYQGEFTVTASGGATNPSPGTFPATATISQQKSNLSIVIVAPQGGALTFNGTIAAGGDIALENDAGLMFLAGALPQCSFADAVASNTASRAGGRLILKSNIVGASCRTDTGCATACWAKRRTGSSPRSKPPRATRWSVRPCSTKCTAASPPR